MVAAASAAETTTNITGFLYALFVQNEDLYLES